MKSSKFLSDLSFHALNISSSPEEAQIIKDNFLDKFDKLGKFEQFNMAVIIETMGFEEAFIQIHNYAT